MAECDRADVGELRRLLQSPEVKKDPEEYFRALQRVIACMSHGIDVSKLFSEMIMASATTDLAQKKLVYLYLSNYAESNPDLALLTINTLQKDLQDWNPVVRGLALRTMFSLKLPDMKCVSEEALYVGLKDKSAYVRKTAVLGIVKIFHIDPEVVDKINFVDILYDRDPQVVSNCISSLVEILAAEGGLVITEKIAHYLLNRLKDFSEWGQCQVLELLRRYRPSSENELFDILNVLDDRLRHTNSGVVLATIHLFFHFTDDVPHLQQDVYDRIKSPLLTMMGSKTSEVIYTCLLHAQLLLARQPQLWSDSYQIFLCRYNDPSYVKVKKLELLTEVCTVDNVQSIIDEFVDNATDVNTIVAKKAIQAIGKIALRLPGRANACANKLLSLLATEISYVTSESIVSLANVLREFDTLVEVIIPQLPVSFKGITEEDGRAALIWILGEYGESLPHAPYMLEELVKNISEESSSSVKLQLLSAVMKMFFKRPPECQEMLGTLLEHSIDFEMDMDVHGRGMLYYRLLKHGVEVAQKVVCGQAKMVTEENTVTHRLSLFPEFNSLSVLYGESSSSFIAQECPYIICLTKDASSTPSERRKFDVILEQVPTSEQPRSPRAILNSLTCKGQESTPAILLKPTPSMSAEEFERLWKSMDTVEELHVHLDQVPSAKKLTKNLASRFIVVIASSDPDLPVIKFYFYAQHVSTLDMFLVEVNLAVANSMLSFVLKCENHKLAPNFMQHFFGALGLTGTSAPMLHWTVGADIPSSMKNAQGVYHNYQLYVGGGFTGSTKADAIVFVYAPGVDMWKLLPSSPLKWFGMAILQDQLLLIGGKETASTKSDYTNKLVAWNGEDHLWSSSFPPMQLARTSPVAFSHKQWLVVSGGKRGSLDFSAEVLDSDTRQWSLVPSLPFKCFTHTSAICVNTWYLLRESDGTVFKTDVRKLLKHSLQETPKLHNGDANGQNEYHDVTDSDWTSLSKPPVKPIKISILHGCVVVLSHSPNGDGHIAVHAYFPETRSWSHVGNLPGICANASCISTTANGPLFIAGGDSADMHYSNKIFKATLRESVQS